MCAMAALGVPRDGVQSETRVPKKDMSGISLFLPDQISWKEGPASLPRGTQVAILEGDPSRTGPFVMRLRLPDGYRIPPHVHPKVERITVISGTFNIGMGQTFDKNQGRAMPAGTFGSWQPGMKHFVWATGETIIQLHGEGPWELNYLNPADDPRKATKEKDDRNNRKSEP